ncbi:hypothetical protein K438DRAFT_2026760 [Mycena galopus ATCC 62051]|nr:hypothetical protein K438DRAFT_2026760 [Mycena galopus ATCC 62051]
MADQFEPVPPPNLLQSVIEGVELRMYVLMAEIFFYGTYVVIFAFYVNILQLTNKSDLALAFSPTSSLTPPMQMFGAFTNATNVIYVTSNVIADIIFMFRCYAVWNFRRRVVAIPALCTLVVAVLGYFNAATWLQGFELDETRFLLQPSVVDVSYTPGLFGISILLSLLTTLILMGLSAGRIWWLARTARQVLGVKSTSRYYVICAMILESGAMYSLGVVIFIAISWTTVVPQSGVIDTTGGAVLGQLVGLAPTIIAVRVGLGQSVESVGSFGARENSGVQSRLEFRATATDPSIEHRVIRIGSDWEDEPGKTESV